MKIVINRDYGGFRIPKELVNELHVADEWDYYDVSRTDPRLIKGVENGSDNGGDLIVLEIPQDATDHMITEYDGKETLYYVIDGKIHCAF